MNKKIKISLLDIITAKYDECKLTNSFAVFLASVTCYVFIYFYELSHFTLSIDEEPKENYIHTIANGRWGDALLKRFLLPEPYIPFFTQFLSIIILSLTSIILCRFNRFNLKQSMIFSLMCCAIPQVAFQMQYTQQIDTYAIGCMLAVISTAFMFYDKNKKILILFGFLSITFILGIYQSLILIPITIFLFKCYSDNLTIRVFIKRSAAYLIFLIGSALLYSKITKEFITHYGKNDLGYFSDRVAWFHAPFKEVSETTVKEISLYFSGNSIYSLESFSIIGLFIATGIASSVKKRNYLSIFKIIFIALSPFLFNIISGGYQSPRVLSSLPYCFAFMAIIGLQKINIKLTSLLIILLITIACAKTSNLFYSEQLRHEQDVAYSNRLIASIYISSPKFDQRKNMIYFFGSPNLPEPLRFNKNIDSFNQSWFNMFNGSNARITHFMQYMGFSDFRTPAYEQLVELIPEINKMPVYPETGSIKFFAESNVLVVKLGENEGSKY